MEPNKPNVVVYTRPIFSSEEISRIHQRQYCDLVKEFISMLKDSQTFLKFPKFKEWEREALEWVVKLIEKEKESI